MSTAQTWPLRRLRRPRRRPGLPRPITLGLWPLGAGLALAAAATLVDLLGHQAGGRGIANLLAARLLSFPLSPHSSPVQLGGGSLLLFGTVLAVAVLAGRQAARETRWPATGALVAAGAAPFLIVSLLLAAIDRTGSSPGLLGVLRALVPALWVMSALLAGAAWQTALMGTRRLAVAAARGLGAGAFAAAIALAGLAAVALLTSAASGLRRLTVAGVVGWLLDALNGGAQLLVQVSAHQPGRDLKALALLAAVLLILTAAGLAATLFLLPTPAIETAVFVATFALVLALAGSGARAHPAGDLSALVPGLIALLLLPAVLAAVAGPWAAGHGPAHAFTSVPPLREFADRLPRPVASPIGPSSPRLVAGWRSAAAVALAAVLVEALLVLVVASPLPAARTPLPAPASGLELVAERYLAAAAHGDAAAAWAEMVVDEPVADANAVHLDDETALAAMLANPAARPAEPTNLRLVSARPAGTDTAAEFSAGNRQERHPALLLRKVAASWKVVIRAGAADVALANLAPTKLDGIVLPVRPASHVILLPGPHTISSGDGQVQRADSTALQVSSGATARVQLAPSFTADAVASAADVARSLLDACTASTAIAPPGCLQSAAVSPPVTWRRVGEPAGISLAWESEHDYVASGRYQYIAAYRVHVPEGIAHAAATGAFRLPLRWTGAAFAGRGAMADLPGLAAARPAVDDQVLRQAVSAKFAECASSTLLRPPDCPNALASSRYVTPVAWKLLTDPTADSAIEYDPVAAEFSVIGAFRMSASYTEGGIRKNGISAGGFRASIIWDGSAPVVVTIRAT